MVFLDSIVKLKPIEKINKQEFPFWSNEMNYFRGFDVVKKFNHCRNGEITVSLFLHSKNTYSVSWFESVKNNEETKDILNTIKTLSTYMTKYSSTNFDKIQPKFTAKIYDNSSYEITNNVSFGDILFDSPEIAEYCITKIGIKNWITYVIPLLEDNLIE